MNKEIVKNQAEVIARVFEQHTSHKMAHSTALEIVSNLYGKKNFNVLSAYMKPKTALAELSDFEQDHAKDNIGTDYGDECVITSTNGRKLKTAAYPNECDYVRVTDRADNEIAYWSCDEWEQSPMEVMGAIIGALNGGPKIELPSFATQKGAAIKVLQEPLCKFDIEQILEAGGACEVIIKVELDDISAGIEHMNDTAETAITNFQQFKIDDEDVSVTISDISYTPVGAENGSILMKVNCQIETY